MKVKKLILSVRFAIQDLARTKVSDIQMLEHLNDVLSMINVVLAASNSSLTLTREHVFLNFGQGMLPCDLNALYLVTDKNGKELTNAPKRYPHRLLNHYKIRGNNIYADHDELIIEYKRYYCNVESLDDTIQLPIYFFNLLKKYVALVATGGGLPLMEEMTASVQALTRGRDYTEMEIIPSFYV